MIAPAVRQPLVDVMLGARGRARAFALTAIMLTALWLSVSAYVLHSMFPFNAVALPAESDIRVRLWAPQGWKFFTRNPREDWLLPFSRSSGGSWQSASLGPNGRLDAYFGISRRPRAQGIEIGLLLFKVPKAAWDECDHEPTVCLERSPIKATLRNRSPRPTMCGMVGFVQQKQTPWAWEAKGATPKHMPSRVAKFEVKC